MKIDLAQHTVEIADPAVSGTLPVAYKLLGLAFVAVVSAVSWSLILALSAMAVGVELGTLTLLGVGGAIGAWSMVVAAAVMQDRA